MQIMKIWICMSLLHCVCDKENQDNTVALALNETRKI